ncbi:MAG: universal stress protein [Acidobacteriota bacterium]
MEARPKILIAYDGSEGADIAISDLKLAGLSHRMDAIVITVGELSLSFPPSYGMVETDFAERHSTNLKEAQALVSKGCECLRALFPTWEISPEASIGSAAGEILTKADSWKPDLILLGSHGRSRLSRMMFGSIAQQVVTEAHCSVRIGRKSTQEESHPARIIIGLDGSACASAAVDIVAMRQWPKGSVVKLITSTNSEEIEELAHAQKFRSRQRLS